LLGDAPPVVVIDDDGTADDTAEHAGMLSALRFLALTGFCATECTDDLVS